MSRTVRAIYLARVAFAAVWVALVRSLHPTGDGIELFACVLLVLYPLSDAAASSIERRRDPISFTSGAHAVNAFASTAAAVAVAVTAAHHLVSSMDVFAAWAIIAGLIQLAIAAHRLGRIAGQWPMIVSGAGSIFAGTTFLGWTEGAGAALDVLAQYSIGGAIWYLLSALWIVVAGSQSRASEIL
jgi:hypothetical protein